ncbi:MAG: Rossmann-like and DUF2520 domain-containing protein [Macellibacteroides fermentans]|uniref:Rossmann-like and DUF2520 domain-containing protein n=1 Tax=Macellibacteroides fermentans TaxID=879969 RepID=UPI003AD20D13
MKVVFIGSGNLATHLSLAMKVAGIEVVQVYSQTESHASLLANKLSCSYTTEPELIVSNADIYIFSVKDSALLDLIHKIPQNKGLWLHTAGSVPMGVFEGFNDRYGVLYPLQTFSKNRDIDFSNVPVFIESNSAGDEAYLLSFAGKLTKQVIPLSSEKRKHLHLAAVWACNFTNHMYLMASKILQEQSLSESFLLPLIDETAAKVHQLSAREAQTGPAIRYDENIIEKHIELLSDPNMKELYRLISRNIHKESSNE